MQISKRINARKILLSYLYQHCFFVRLEEALEKQSSENSESSTKDPFKVPTSFFDQDFLETIEKLQNSSQEEQKHILAVVHDMIETPVEEEIPYYLQNFFDKRKESEIDIEYLLRMGAAYTKYYEELKKEVDSYAQTFTFDQMDPADQAIFLLGYTERKELETPKEILINEMIELAKRYSDFGASKLINGIMHKILSQ